MIDLRLIYLNSPIQNEDGTEKELKRSQSQELLLVEAEKDIGEICDLIGDDDQTPEEDYGGQAVCQLIFQIQKEIYLSFVFCVLFQSGEENRNAEEADEKNQEHSEAAEITTNEDDYEKDDLSTNQLRKDQYQFRDELLTSKFTYPI